jgi:hypothetical protein
MLQSTSEGLGPIARTVPDANHSHVGQPVVRPGMTFGGHTRAQDADAKCSHYAPGPMDRGWVVRDRVCTSLPRPMTARIRPLGVGDQRALDSKRLILDAPHGIG